MKWDKRGCTYMPTGGNWTHASTPFAEHISGDYYRVYYSSRDEKNRSHIFTLSMDVAKNTVVAMDSKPVVSPGEPGTFDDSGASMGWLCKAGDSKYLYYLGWNLGVTVPWRNAIGRVEIFPDGLISRPVSPEMDRSELDPYSLSYPWVEGGEMLYGSNLGWGARREEMRHVIKRAVYDGGRWESLGIVLNIKDDEYALCRPCKVGNEIWYSYKGPSHNYRIGVAIDGERVDHLAGIDVSSGGWDSDAICYAHVFLHKGQKHMLYNGNGHGKSGFGLAVEC